MSDLPADPAAPVVGRQLAVCQHLRVKEVVLQQNTNGNSRQFRKVPPRHRAGSIHILNLFNSRESKVTYHFSAWDGVERSPKQLSPIYKGLHDEVCH